jgi:hypothetical protein
MSNSKLNKAISDVEIEVPDEHRKLVSQRITKSRQNPDRMLEWKEASKKLKP